MANENIFGENLMALRKKAGITRRELANALGINENTLTGYENSGREPRYDLLVRIADAFGVTVDELIRPEKETFMDVPYAISNDGKDPVVKDASFRFPITNFEKRNLTVLLSNFEDAFKEILQSAWLKVYVVEQEKFTNVDLNYDSNFAKLNLNFQIRLRNLEFTDQPKEE